MKYLLFCCLSFAAFTFSANAEETVQYGSQIFDRQCLATMKHHCRVACSFLNGQNNQAVCYGRCIGINGIHCMIEDTRTGETFEPRWK